jgi:hypothetical protein
MPSRRLLIWGFIRLGIAGMGAVTSVVAEGPWAIAGALAAIAVFILTIYQLIIAPIFKHLYRKRKIKRAMRSYFLIPMLSQGRSVYYAIQDEREHRCTNIVLPPDSKTLVEFWFRPTISFKYSYMLFGCKHDDRDSTARNTKPRPLKMIDVYPQGHIEKGCLPGETPGHVINARYQYRWNRDIHWNGRSTLAIGIIIQTFNIGVYTWQTFISGDEIDDLFELTIHVENPSNVLLTCHHKEDHPLHTLRALFERRMF